MTLLVAICAKGFVTTYAAVAVKISTGRAVVKIARTSEKRHENPATAPSLFVRLSMK